MSDMVMKDISRSRILRITDKFCAFMAAFTFLAFFLYALGAYQNFVVLSRMMLLKACMYSSVLLMGFSFFSSLLIIFFTSGRKGFLQKKLFLNILLLIISAVFLYLVKFIIACAVL